MKTEDFRQTLSKEVPPAGLDAPLRALWWDGRGDWEKAHAEVDELETKPAMLVHAYLHRKHGDESNAAYWYRQIGKPFPSCTLQEESAMLLTEFLRDSE